MFFFFSGEQQKFRLSQIIFAAGGLGSHVTITFRDKSRYDLIVFFFVI